ncbi:gp58-like family protein [Lactiplantibacillus plantarum]|uniref:gp58-like family protein n=1 Tax=Lactiplantibacillus plantarum TaxID=1590 RepID=UPI00217DD11D|nr:gp58-like family protein [Lactiplantibacillus plantarum]UWF30231.1 gp58-like family protein [Lactiplantibacillus plantarum]UWF40329.1 gp58-like family protein [Lactiplantibacillus plantarum]UWF43328.1 gp58-like family protein [Lactiplantibacillus plantarum]
MIKQSDLALAAWKATERTLDAVVTINKIDYKTTDIASISYDAGGYTGDTFGIGSNYENSVTIKFSHLIEGLKPGMTVWPKIGIKTSNGYEYSSLGLFIVSDDIQMDRNNDETTIKAYDQMCLLEGTYTSKLTYPAKMTSVIAEIANLAGVLLNTTDISRLPVQVDLPSAITGQTYRNAIGMIAQFYAGFVTFDRDGKLTIRTIAEPDYTLDPSQYEQGGLTKNEAPYKIGGIQCEVTTTTTDSTGQSTETTNTLQVGATSGSQIKLTNSLMTMDRLTSIWQQLQSLTFYPFSLNWFGNPAIEAGDWLTLQDTKGNKFNVPNNGYTMTFDGSLSAVSKADQTSTSSSSYAWRGELSQYVADLGGRQGASGNYIYGTDTTEPPYGAKFNDIWYKQNGNKVELWTYERQADGTGKWVLTVSDATGEEVKAKVDQVELEAKASTDAAKAASDKADQLAAKYDDTNALANQALDQAIDAQNSTAGLIDDVNKASQNADDAKSIANSVNSKYTSLTDGSTMTIAELENGLAVKLTKDDLSGYATETWTQNQIKVSDDIINSTLSSVKTTVDGHTTSINSLKADSSGFKAQFITVNDTLGKQTKDIGTLQATNKSLSAGFDSLNADNTVNQHNISQLQLTATSLSNTIENVNQKVEDGLISTNIFRSANDFSRSYWTDTFGYPFTTIQSESRYHDSLIHYQGQGKTPAPYSTIAQQTITDNAMAADTWYTLSFYARGAGDNNTVGKFGMYFYGNGSDQSMSSSDGVEVLGTSDTHCIITLTPYFRRYVITFHTPKDFSGGHSFWARNDLDLNDGSLYCDFWHPKLELGKVASDFSVNPADTATISALSSISQTVDAIQTTVRGKVDNDTYQSKVVQLSNQITSVVGQVNTFGKRNIVTNSLFQYNYLDGTSWTGGTTAIWYKSDYAWSWVNGYQGICINQPISTNTDTSWYNLFSRKIVIGSDISTPWSASAYVNVDTVGFNTILIVEFYNTSGVRIGYKEVYKKSGGLQLMKVENAIPPAGTETVCFSFRVHGGGHVAMICPMLNQGTTAAAFVPDNATDAQVQQSYSAILQTQDMISLRVEKNGVINAVNVSSEGIQIYGNKLHITAATYIDNAIIKDAMIANLSANKITAGTINAANINVINLNANNITTGTINGSNLSINLNTGNVQFQAGRIHSADNGIDININSKYISVANNNNRVFISGGEIQMIQPQLFSQQTTPYVRINNAGAGSSWGGATFWARDYFAVTHQHNDGDIFSSPLGTERFSGISGGHSTTGWQVTKIGGAERGVFISGGKEFYTGGIDVSPYIRIGDTGHAGTGMNGSNITMEGNYIYIVSPHTSSHAANAYLASDGALVQSTSAAKYKTDIVRSFETGMGDKLLEVPIAHWKDKEEVLAKTLNPSAKNPDTYFGMIADDLDDAGLNELVDYDDKGKVRGIQYDRVALSLIPLIRNYRDRITELETKVKEMKEA